MALHMTLIPKLSLSQTGHPDILLRLQNLDWSDTDTSVKPSNLYSLIDSVEFLLQIKYCYSLLFVMIHQLGKLRQSKTLVFYLS